MIELRKESGLLMMLAIMVVGLLTIVQVIPVRKLGSIIFWIVLAGLILPILFPPVFWNGGSPWWMYLLCFIGVLIGIRLFLDAILLWRRRRY